MIREVIKEKVRLLAAFQPGASPAGLTNRFPVYNSVGLVRAHNSEEESSLDVEFHDIAVHHTIHLANTDNCTMAALSSKLLALASPQKVTVNYFSSGDVSKEWSIEMGEEESVEGVAVGDGLVVVVNSNNYLRLLCAGGMQRSVVCLTLATRLPGQIGLPPAAGLRLRPPPPRAVRPRDDRQAGRGAAARPEGGGVAAAAAHEGEQQGQVGHALHRGRQPGGVGGPDHPLQGIQVLNHDHCPVMFLQVLIREMY